MKFPWRKKEEENEFQQRIEDLEEKVDEYRGRFEAEKERRSNLSSEIQEVEKENNRLKDRIRNLKTEDDDQEEEQRDEEYRELEFEEFYSFLKKISTVESNDRDLVTIYSSGKAQNLQRFRDLKNSLPRDKISRVQDRESVIAFMDGELLEFIFKAKPFFGNYWLLEDSFDTDNVIEFIDDEKIFVLVSAGNTRIFREKSGEFELLERISSRIDREHSKGGFSQSRFERKREQQKNQHVQKIKEELPDDEEIYLLGEKDLCNELRGKYLGGFDPNKSIPEVFYDFRLITSR